jgi:centromeric protein E
VFDASATTRQLFDGVAKDVVQSVVKGYNGTIFAYGQTAAGKTFTMLGDKEQPGVLPLAVNEIMDAISSTQHRAFLIRCSYIEIYNEGITDLLDDAKKQLAVHESKTRVSSKWWQEVGGGGEPIPQACPIAVSRF